MSDIKSKHMNWAALVVDVIEAEVITQQRLSELCGVSQQSISNWTNSNRSPGVNARQILRDLAAKNSLSLDLYSKPETSRKITVHQKRYLESLQRLSKRDIAKVMNFADALSV